MDYQFWLKCAAARLINSDTPKRDAEILLSFVSGHTRTFLLAFGETQLNQEQQYRLNTLLIRREKGEPVAYLVGEREFWSLPLSVSPAAMIPRPDSECLVTLALECLSIQPCHILDLGTGTGAIALAIASERPDCIITGIDIQEDALALAKYNALKLMINNVQFLQSNWFSTVVDKRFSLIASNPPYIDANDLHFIQGDLRYEPTCALLSSQKGLADLEVIVRQSPHYLQAQGWLLLEHGFQQSRDVRALMLSTGFISVSTYRDYGNNERVTLGQWKSVDT